MSNAAVRCVTASSVRPVRASSVPASTRRFWLTWIAVDVVGVPLLWHSHYYPTAILYVVYGGLVVWGFVVWLRASRRETPLPIELRPDHEIAGEKG